MAVAQVKDTKEYIPTYEVFVCVIAITLRNTACLAHCFVKKNTRDMWGCRRSSSPTDALDDHGHKIVQISARSPADALGDPGDDARVTPDAVGVGSERGSEVRAEVGAGVGAGGDTRGGAVCSATHFSAVASKRVPNPQYLLRVTHALLHTSSRTSALSPFTVIMLTSWVQSAVHFLCKRLRFSSCSTLIMRI